MLELINDQIDAAVSATPSRHQIEAFEAHLLQHDQVEIPVKHRFSERQYAREITIPADTLMTGAVHKHQHVSIMVSGEMMCLTEDGMQHIEGYHVFISPPGTKRVGYAIRETVWITVHAVEPGWDETKIPELEAFLVEPSIHKISEVQQCQLSQPQ